MSALNVDVSHVEATLASSDALLRVRLIGQMDVRTADGRSMLPAGRKTRALFAMLALSLPRSLARTRAAETLWSRRPTDQARASLRQELHRLLEGLGALAPQVLDIARDQIQLRPGACWVDVTALQRATVDDPTPLELLSGTLMEGLDGVDPALDAWMLGERERLTDWARRLADRILQAQGEPLKQIEAANRVLAIDRGHEGAWRSLIRGYAASGDPAMAMQAFERCRASLAERLRRGPSPETDQLIEEISRRSGPPPGGVAHEFERVAAAAAEAPGAPVRLGIVRLDIADDGASHARLATGLANELCVALARFRWSSVVCLTHRLAPTASLAGLRATAGIDLLLDGSIAASSGDSVAAPGGPVRVELRLLDLRCGGTLVWSQRFEHASDNSLTVQDEIAAVAAAQIDAEMLSVEARHAGRKLAESPSAYQLTMMSRAAMNVLTRDSIADGGALLQRAVAVDPGYAPAWAGIASWHLLLASQGWVDDPRERAEQASQAAERAISLDARDARSLSIAAMVAGYMQHRLEHAIALNRRALAINPNLPMGWAFSAFSQLFAGEIATAEEHLARYKHLAPMLPNAYRYDSAFIYAALLRRDFAAAGRIGREVSALSPLHTLPLRPYLSALGHLGAQAEAANVREQLLKLQPDFNLDWFAESSPFVRWADTEVILEGLRLAGVPD